MRDRESWHRKVSERLAPHWDASLRDLGIMPAQLCQVELALTLLAAVVPGASAEGAYTLLGGYPFHRAVAGRDRDRDAAVHVGRHLLWTLRRGRAWKELLDAYREVPARLREFALPPAGSGTPARRVGATVCPERTAVYEEALSELPGFVMRPLAQAPAGRSSFRDGRGRASVDIPEGLLFDRAPGHDLGSGRAGGSRPLHVARADLEATARWMDDTEIEMGVSRPGRWSARLQEVEFALRDEAGGTFRDSDTFPLDGLLHLVGMVGAGKTTLMVLVAVWAARRGLRTTLVVGDVATQLTLTETLCALGLRAVPILGASSRHTHAEGLHRRLASRGTTNLLDHHSAGFEHLSTACAVNGLRGPGATEPLRYVDAPCIGLHPHPRATAAEPDPAPVHGWDPFASATAMTGADAARPEADQLEGTAHGCPIWARCPRHQTVRDTVDALVWVANPASLVQTAVPGHLNDERLRHLELAVLRSDIVFVDEADVVQMRLDDLFAPSATLVRPNVESWLDRLHTHKIEELSRHGRVPLTDRDVEQWNSALAVVTAATDRLYRLLISDRELRAWVSAEYFSPWTLQEELLLDWFEGDDRQAVDPTTFFAELDSIEDDLDLYEGYEDVPEDLPEGGERTRRPGGGRADPDRRLLARWLDDFRDDPLGGAGPYGSLTDTLIDVARDLLYSQAPRRTKGRVADLLRAMLPEVAAVAMEADAVRFDLNRRRLEFLLVLCTLHHRLERLTFLWPQVEAALRLDSRGGELARRAPLDYAPLIPEAPMGNVLGFQYLPEDSDESEADPEPQASGTLRFFRYAGVGRELLPALSRIGSDPFSDLPGPHVVLMSGTSWAGESTRAHVTVPVRAVLKPSRRTREAVLGTTFSTHFLYDERTREPMFLSGTPQKARLEQARAMALRLARRSANGSASPLDLELARVGDDDRRRVLLLVGSYREAAAVAEALQGEQRWSGRVRLLVPDRAGDPEGDGDPADVESAVRRGDVAMFAEDPMAEVLVAPVMAIERGHNILNAQGKAAFGVAMFLARPHPRPDDLTLAVYCVNDWITRFVRDLPRRDDRPGPAGFTDLVRAAGDLDSAGLALRSLGRSEWRRVLARRYVFSGLPAWEKRSFAWDQLVTLWQVIGRLVRGGVPARVVFVDAAFAPRTAWSLGPTVDRGRRSPDGLLEAFKSVLAPYFSEGDRHRFPDRLDPVVARALYEPFHQALHHLDHHRSTG
ncbi:hypothetical protein ACQKM2_06720 [Streptomyces sp. NPDC004126]|uniref:pPIWI_RE_Z domain-containing protein n=1 Tax=Streptomyces sp. NPDC004126 TaxID=3390695 RepID=UPI003CFC9E51